MQERLKADQSLKEKLNVSASTTTRSRLAASPPSISHKVSSISCGHCCCTAFASLLHLRSFCLDAWTSFGVLYSKQNGSTFVDDFIACVTS